jgi:hypothetical protein
MMSHPKKSREWGAGKAFPNPQADGRALPPDQRVPAARLFRAAPPLNFALALSGVRMRHCLLGLRLPIAIYCLFFDYLAVALRIR